MQSKRNIHRNKMICMIYHHVGKDPATKLDEFLEKCQRGGKGVIFTVNTAYTVDTVDIVDTVDTVKGVDSVEGSGYQIG